MNIIEKCKWVDFEDVETGSTFEFDDRLWMACNAASEGNAVNLRSGEVRWIKGGEPVRPVAGSFVVEGYDA